MAENKKKVIVYTDWIDIFQNLTDVEAGKLIKHFFGYVNDLNPIADDRIVELMFIPIKATLKRDLKTWEDKQVINKINGAKGGRPKKPNETQNNPTVNLETQRNPKKGVSVSVSVSDSVKVNVSDTNNNIIYDRKLKFASTLKPFTEKYGREMIKDFYEYWTEPNKSNTKFRQESEKNWSVERRLSTWSKNNINFKNLSTNENGKQITKQDKLNNELNEWVGGIQTNGELHEGVDSGEWIDN